jgi:hypothetical protein
MLSVRNLEILPAKSVLRDTGIAFFVLFIGATSHVFFLQDIPEKQPPLPVVVVFALLAVWSFYVSFKRVIRHNFN